MTGTVTQAHLVGAGTDAPDFSIEPLGPFSLEEAATFGFGQRDAATYDGVMRLAFCVDGYESQAAVEVRQDGAGVHGWIQGDADPATVRTQVARVLSLDHDGRRFTAVGERDPVIARLRPWRRDCGRRCSTRPTRRQPGRCSPPGGRRHRWPRCAGA